MRDVMQKQERLSSERDDENALEFDLPDLHCKDV